MKIDRKRLDSSIERKILIGMIVSDKFIKRIQPIIDPKLLEGSFIAKVVLWCLEYFNTYHKAPQRHIEDIFHVKVENDRIGDAEAEMVSDFLTEISNQYEQEKFNVEYVISYSEQKPSTDTIAVDLDNKPFRETDGSILFRPGGHGALIENLNDIKGDIIFIKNIDNIVPDKLREPTYIYKKVIAGYLIELQKKIFELLL